VETHRNSKTRLRALLGQKGEQILPFVCANSSNSYVKGTYRAKRRANSSICLCKFIKFVCSRWL